MKEQLRWQKPDLALTDLLGTDPHETVVVAIGNWVDKRRMRLVGTDVKFEQCREAGGEWVLTEFVEPEVKNWYWVARNAFDARLATPEIAWLGPVENIPDDLLRGDQPLNVRRVDQVGWVNLRATAQEACEANA